MTSIGYNHRMAPSPQPAGGAEGTSGGAVSVLSTPPPPSQITAALDDLLWRQDSHHRAVRRLRTVWIASVCALAALHALLWLLERYYG